MKIAYLFPGQGSQYVGMGKDLYENYDEIKEVYDKASDILGIDIRKLSFEGPEDELNQTKNTQIAILIMSLGILKILSKNGIEADIAAGLSLGEYTALIYAGAMSFEDGIKIVRKRGELMQDNVPAGEWNMAGIIGLADETVEEICKSVQSGFVVPANYNCTGQVVVSGEKQAVEEVMSKSKEAGAKLAVLLKTSGPFHTKQLAVASEKLSAELAKVDISSKMSKVVVRNVDGEAYAPADDVRAVLARHVMCPVRFKKSIQKMLELGFDTFVEVGPR